MKDKTDFRVKDKEVKKNKLNVVMQKNKIVLVILILLCVIGYAVSLAIKLIKNPTNTFLVEQGQIYQEEVTNGYIIREETVLKGENYKNGMSQIKIEGEKVAKGEAIFRYYSNGENSLVKKIEELDKKIDEAMAKETGLFSSDTKTLENQIAERLDNVYNESDLQKIREYKKDINTYITKKAKIAGDLSPSGSYLKKLINERSRYENSLNSGAEYLKAPISGVVSYRVDGYESILKPGKYDEITGKFLQNLNLKTGQIIVANNESGKIINNYKCYIAVVLDSEYARKAKVNDKLKLRLPSGNEVEAEIEHINKEKDNKRVIIFSIEKCVEELINYRKISIDVIWWSDSGKKIPNSAIKYEEINGNKLAYVIRTRAGYKDKIYIKELRTNGKYSIVTNYTGEELEELGDVSSERKTISLYDEIIVQE